MQYFILFPEDTEKEVVFEDNLLGESSFKTFLSTFPGSSIWDEFRVKLGSIWDQLDQCGIQLGSNWNQFGIKLGSIWDQLSIWDQFGIILGSH